MNTNFLHLALFVIFRFQSDKKLNYDLNFCQALVPLNFIDGKKIWANNKVSHSF